LSGVKVGEVADALDSTAALNVGRVVNDQAYV